MLLCLSVAGLGCDTKPAPAEAAKPTPQAEQQTPPAAQPGDAAADPHAGMAQPPHGAAGPVAAPPGPPRDVTPSGETREELVDGLKMTVPTEWARGSGSSMMRKAEFTLPGPGGDATLVVYRFEGGAGSTAQNIERWKQQIELADGTEAVTGEVEANGLKVTSVDLRGRYAGQSMPGAPPQPAIAEARMLAAAIEGGEGGEGVGDPWYFKLVGPAATLDVWSEGWTKLLAGLAPAA